MWAVVKPLMDPAKIGRDINVATSTLLWEDRSGADDSFWPRTKTNPDCMVKLKRCVANMIRQATPPFITCVSSTAELVAQRWFIDITGYIVNHANSQLANGNNINRNCVGREQIACAIRDTYTKKDLTYSVEGSGHPLETIEITPQGFLFLLDWVCKTLFWATRRASSTCRRCDKKKMDGDNILWALDSILLNRGQPVCDDAVNDAVNRRHRITSLPLNIIESHILPALPFDAILRLKSVCKDWNSSFPSPYFHSLIEQQQNPQTLSIGFFNRNHQMQRTIWLHEHKSHNKILDLVMIEAASFLPNTYTFVCGSCNGLLCICIASRREFLFAVGNPLTAEWDLLPSPILPIGGNICNRAPGLAVDTSNTSSSYKLVLLAYGGKRLFQVFSSEIGEWKILKAKPAQVRIAKTLEKDHRDSVYLNGVIYWQPPYEHNLQNKVFWLDIEKDEAGHIDFPHKMPIIYSAIGRLEENCGKQRLTCTMNLGDQRVLEGYVLRDHNQWEKLYVVDISLLQNRIRPFPYNGGEVVVFGDSHEITAYNIRTDESSVIAKDPKEILYGRIGNSFAFRMSLLPLPKIKSRSKTSGYYIHR